MDTIAILQEVLEYIDGHVADELSVGLLAERAGFSPWHFCRVFQWGTGYSVMGYVRSRRLAFATDELGTGRRILDISLEYGFETHSGFSRAFRRRFGCPPETYRLRARCGLPLPPDLNKMRNYSIEGIVLEPNFITLPAVRLAGFALKTTAAAAENVKTIPAFWNAYLRDGRMEKLYRESFVKKHAEYGACFPEDPETGEFEYVIGVEPKESAPIPEEYRVCELPPATYAVFSTPPCGASEFSSSIQGVWSTSSTSGTCRAASTSSSTTTAACRRLERSATSISPSWKSGNKGFRKGIRLPGAVKLRTSTADSGTIRAHPAKTAR